MNFFLLDVDHQASINNASVLPKKTFRVVWVISLIRLLGVFVALAVIALNGRVFVAVGVADRGLHG